MGELRLWKLAEHVIQREFGDAEGPIAAGFSHNDFGLVVQPLDDAAGELFPGVQVVQQEVAMVPRAAESLLRCRGKRARAAAVGAAARPQRRFFGSRHNSTCKAAPECLHVLTIPA